MSKAENNRVHVNYDVICNRLSAINMTKTAVSSQLGYSLRWLSVAKSRDARIRTKDAMELCELLGLNFDDIVVEKKKNLPNRVHVNYDVICNCLSAINMTKAAVSRQLGYTSVWLNVAKSRNAEIRTKDAMELCELLGLNFDDIVVEKKKNLPNRVHVNYDVICNRLSAINMTQTAVSSQLGYSLRWLSVAKSRDARIRTKDVMKLCELLGLNFDDIVVKENQPKSVPEAHQTDDLISRQAVYEMLDGVEIPGNANWYLYYQQALDRLSKLPSAEPEIIRCKDCKHSEHWYRDKRRCFLWAEDGIDVFDNGFCNYAERRTDE